jgi:hypothetical protein
MISRRAHLLTLAAAAALAACGGSDGGPAGPPPPAPPPPAPPPPPPPPAVPAAGTLIVKYGEPIGIGTVDGSRTQAMFDTPTGLAAGVNGALYVADTQNGMIRHVTREGDVTTLSGKRAERGVVDGPAAAARFRFPTRMALATDGTLYVVDRMDTGRAGGVLRAIARDGSVSTVPGVSDVISVAAEGGGGLVLVIGHAIYRRTPAGTLQLVAGARDEAGLIDGPGTEARFQDPIDVAVDPAGVIYLTQRGQNRMSRVLTTGVVTSQYRTNNDPPSVLAVDGSGVVWFRTVNGFVEKFDAPTPGCRICAPADGSFELGLAFDSDGIQVMTTTYGLLRYRTALGPPEPVGGQSSVVGTMPLLTVDNDGNSVALFPFDPLVSDSLRRFDSAGRPVWIRDDTGLRHTRMGIAVDRGTNEVLGSAYRRSADDGLRPNGGAIYRLGQSGDFPRLAEWPAAAATAPAATAPGPMVGGQDGAFYFIDLSNGDVMRWTQAQGLARVIARADYAGTPFTFSRGSSGYDLLANPHKLAADRQGTVYLVFEGGLLRIRQGRAETLVAKGTFAEPATNLYPDNSFERLATATNVAVDNKDRVFVSDREVIHEVLADGRLQVRAGVAGTIGFRAGPLPASLSQLHTMVAGPDGTLHVFGANQLAVLRID